VIKSTGDGLLVEFGNALEATRCAVAMQGAVTGHQATRAPDRRARIRIGLHLGDVEIRDGDVLGDGVNIAARVEGLARPGGICLTEAVAHEVGNKLEQPLEPAGARRLKNIAEPMRLYHVVLPWVPGLTASRWSRAWARPGVRAGAALLGGLVVIGIGWFAMGGRTPSVPERRPVRVSMMLPEGDSLNPYDIALSPDGSRLAFVGQRGQRRRLYLRSLDDLVAHPLEGSEGAMWPFFSPDGAWVGFLTAREIKKVSVLGGAPQTIATLPGGPAGASWGQDGMIVFADEDEGPLWRVDASGGELEPLTTPERVLQVSQDVYYDPQVLPGGEILFSVFHTFMDMRIAVHDPRTGEERIVVERGSRARWLAPGYLVYAWQGDLLVAPFDVEAARVTGPAMPVVRGVATYWGMDPVYDVSANGTLIYAPGDVDYAPDRLGWVDRDGRVQLLDLPEGLLPRIVAPRLSPDGRRLLIGTMKQNVGFWIYDLARGTARRITPAGRDYWWAAWSPDGTRIAVNSDLHGGRSVNLYLIPADGDGEPERIGESRTDDQVPYSWSGDGRTLFYMQRSGDTGLDLWAVDVAGDRERRAILRTSDQEAQPAISPDGRWLAYASTESGRWEVYARRYPGMDGVTRISKTGGLGIAWGQDGRSLYYKSLGGDSLMEVPVEPGGDDPFGEPHPLFTGSFVEPWPWGRRYDVAADGRRFLMTLREAPPVLPTGFVLVLDWLADVESLLAD
jgi:Tol biopolymer transport system component